MKLPYVNRGEAHKNAKLTAEQVLEIHRRANSGDRNVVLAAEFKVTAQTIHTIKFKRVWRHLWGE